jgi:hypothetical protein
MPTFESIYELEKYVDESFKIALKEVADEIRTTLSYNYTKLWYARPFDNVNENYIRTYQLTQGLEVIPVKFNSFGELTVDIIFNPDKIHPLWVQETDKTKFNSYMNWSRKEPGKTESDGKTVAQWVAEWIEEGNNDKTYKMPAKHVFKKTEKQYNSTKIQQKIREILTQKGFAFA